MTTPIAPNPRPWIGLAVLSAILAAAGAGLMVALPAQAPIAAAVVGVAILAGAWAATRAATGGVARDRALTHVIEQAERLQRGEALTYDVPEAVPAVESLEKVAEKVRQMVDARAYIVATERDLDLARRMYRSILPLASVANHGTLRMAGSCTPAAETGGDWWTYRKLSGGRTLVVVGDATGHGVYSAMIGCAAHGAVETLTHVGEDRLTPKAVLESINAAIRVPGADTVSMTCFAALFDPIKGVIQFANASHMLPLVASTSEDGTVTNVVALTAAVPVDNLDDSEVFSAAEIRTGSQKLATGDLVVLFTDGLTDVRDPNQRAFGHRRLQQAVQAVKLGPGDEGICAVRDSVLDEVSKFAAGHAYEDDVTLVVCAFERF